MTWGLMYVLHGWRGGLIALVLVHVYMGVSRKVPITSR